MICGGVALPTIYEDGGGGLRRIDFDGTIVSALYTILVFKFHGLKERRKCPLRGSNQN